MRNVARFRVDIIVRVFADIVILSLCTIASLCIQFFVLETAGTGALSELLGFNLLSVVPVGIALFSVLGLYSASTRGYPLVPKTIRVAQIVFAAFVPVFLIRELLGAGIILPGKSLLIEWILSIVTIVVCRVWARVWAYLVLSDNDTSSIALRNRIRDKNVLLIGGAGYIGSALLPKLLDDGYKVRLLDSFVYGEEPIAKWMNHRNLEVFRADFRQVDKVVEAMRGMGTVIHLGAIVGDPACALNEELTIEVNLVATRMIAEVAKGAGVSRFIFASTCSVYGVSDNLLDENSSSNPVSLYARSKIACEQVLLRLRDTSFSPVILRFGTIYGLSGRTRFDLVVNLLSAKAVVDREITVFGSKQWRPFIHVEDAARALVMVTEAGVRDLRKMIFNVGSDEQNLTLGQVGSLILDKVPEAKLKIFDENVDVRNYRVNFRRIRDDLGFLPLWNIADGVDQVLQAIESGAVSDYRVPKYSNVRFLEEEGREALKVQNGWAKDLIEMPFLADGLSDDSSLSLSTGD